MDKDYKRLNLLFRNAKGELEDGSMSLEVFKKHKEKCFRKQGERWIKETEYKRLPEEHFYKYEEKCKGCGALSYTQS